MKIRILYSFLLLFLLPALCFANEAEIKGLLKSLTTIDSYGASSIMGMVGDESSMFEERVVGRIMVKSEISDEIKFHIHYENSFSKGEYLSAVEALHGRTANINLLTRNPPKDSTQFFSLTQEYVDDSGEEAYHRLDRLYVEYSDVDYNIRFGRQALTWGGGKVFNPIDIMNPFAPTDVVRDYKNGSDMVTLQAYTELVSDLQIAIVPRRNVRTSELEYDESSASMKLRNSYGDTDAEIVFGSHYGEAFVGGGVAGILSDAVVRSDFILSDGENRRYFSAVANIDYSWLTFDNNTYGYFELYYNNLGVNSIDEVSRDEELLQKLTRGDFYMRDRYYMATGFQYEAHPLINLYTSIIFNIKDYSYILQPRLEWNFRSNMRILLGVDLPEGNLGSEFGGFTDASTGRVIAPAKKVYGQVTIYF
ncbi:MAG: hypothetical protein C0603_12425 [Denitrovibrio sp.]|nr:MAG: hypothetical protein C0603_12425 [Denitrovibrio sp.]